MTQRQRPSKTITLAPDLMERLETEASLTNRSVSQLMEAHLRDYYVDGSAARLDRLEATLNDFRASVLPVVTKVAKYLQELEGEGSSVTKGDGQPPKIATYEEMYGPITRTEERPSPAPIPVDVPKPRRFWNR
jgi:predicted transcriptional regulator